MFFLVPPIYSLQFIIIIYMIAIFFIFLFFYFFFFFFWLFAQRDELEKLVEDAAIWKTAAIDVKSDPEEGHVALEGRRFKRTDTSM